MTVESKDSGASGTSKFLDTVEGEITFFRSLMRARPVGIHRHFHVLTIRNAIFKDTGRVVSVDELWGKLRACYNMDILENIEVDGYDPPGSASSPTPPLLPVRSPSPTENLSAHPWFRHEFQLPHDDVIEAQVASRRIRATASIPSSSPAASPTQTARPSGGREGRKGRSKLKNMAGLVAGDSDSSALTQESGDESIAPTPRESVATGTDAGTEYADDDDGEGREQSPGGLFVENLTARSGAKLPTGIPLATRLGRRTTKASRRGSGSSRARGASAAGGRGGKRKKK